jgi:hypothetical protein
MRIVAILLAACFALPATALGADRFTDPRGDAGDVGPDVTAVTFSHTDTALTIAVEFADAPPLAFEDEGYTDMLLIGIHTDDDLGRTDVEFYTGAHGVDLTRAPVVRAGIASPRAQVGTGAIDVDGATLEITVERSLLGDPEEVAVSVAAGREYVAEDAAGGGGDEAPAAGAFRYSLAEDDGSGGLWPGLAGGVAAAALAALIVVANRRRRPHGPVPLPS